MWVVLFSNLLDYTFIKSGANIGIRRQIANTRYIILYNTILIYILGQINGINLRWDYAE
jgi:hypothetical protein